MPSSRPIKGHVLLDERQERRLRRIRWRRIGLALGFAGALAAVIALYLSPVARVQHVDVHGTALVPQEEVLSLIDLEGKSMLRVNLTAVQQRIEDLPLVSAAIVERSWPRTVSVQVVERAPWGYWQTGGQTVIVDHEGVVLPGVTPPEGAPLIKDLGPARPLDPGDRVDRDAVRLTRALIEQVPETLALSIQTYEFSPEKGLTVTTHAGYRVVIGDSQNMEYKLAVWRAVEEQLGRESMAGHVLDLRFGDRPSFQ